jgi:hypothetical protein
MPAFGGGDLKTLYVTTARAGDGSGGDLYAMEAPVAGLPSPAFDPKYLRAADSRTSFATGGPA